MATVKAKPAKKATQAVKAKPAIKETGLKAPVVGLDGKASGSITLPEELFAAKINKQLMAQAVRVYLANQRAGTASTKTRGEVEGSTRKIYKQKGTGKARHGAVRAPTFVGGGIVFGPRPRDYSLGFPQKMRHVALASALTQQLGNKNIIIVSGLTDVKKTKVMAKALLVIGANRRTLFVTTKNSASVVRAGRNIEGVDILPVSDINTYSILMHGKVVFMKEAIGELRK